MFAMNPLSPHVSLRPYMQNVYITVFTLPPPPVSEVRALNIDEYSGVLFVIALVLLIYFGKKFKK